MLTAVVLTRDGARDSAPVQTLQAGGWHVHVRRLGDGPGSQAAQLLVVDVPAERSVRATVGPVLEAAAATSTPILVVVAESGVREAAELKGVQDFIVKPLRAGELDARARRLRARPEEGPSDRIKIGGLVVDLVGYEVSRDGETLDLTYQEFQLLKFLAAHPGQAFTRDQLLSRVWGYDYFGGSRTVDIHVRRIRAKLGPPYAACVVTIRHVGYKWVPRVDGVGA